MSIRTRSPQGTNTSSIQRTPPAITRHQHALRRQEAHWAARSGPVTTYQLPDELAVGWGRQYDTTPEHPPEQPQDT